MAKPNKIQIDGYDFYFWPYEEQTKMKHKVLAEYFKVWATKLGIYKPVIFFDCHGGCGAYWDTVKHEASWGSSILMAQKAEMLRNDYGRKVCILVAEKDTENADNLRKVISFLKLGVVPQVSDGDFESKISRPEIQKYYRDYPSLFFIDPFGFSLRYHDLQRIMSYPQNELIINFMFDYINRFISFKDQEVNFNQLFGCEDWKEAIPLTGWEREKKIIEIYRRQLKRFSQYVFAYRFSVFDKNRTYYYLFHATDHKDGCTLMKSCFASQNYGKVEYLGNRTGALTLFDLDEVRTIEVQHFLQNRYAGKTISFTGIVEEIIDDTYYLEKDIRAAIRELRENALVTVTPVTSKRNGISGEDRITFCEGTK